MATSKKQYVLYLDESQTHKYNKIKHKKENFHFCMAGVIIAVDDYESVENSVKDLKRNIWSEFPNPERIILHQMSVTDAEKGLLGIDFVNKSENCVGLQIADFVPLSFARDHGGKEQGNPNIFGTLKYHRYDGGIGMKDRFGIKYMP